MVLERWGRRLGSARAWRRGFRRDPFATTVGALFLVIGAAQVVGFAWWWIHPGSLERTLAWAGLNRTGFFGSSLIILGALGLLSAATGVAKPWVQTGFRLRPSRRWRLWGYQAAFAGRGPPDFLEVLGREHGARVAFWRARLRKPPGWRSEFVFLGVDPPALQLSLAVAIVFTTLFWLPVLLGVAVDWGPSLLTSCAFPLFAWSPLITAFVRRRLVVRRLRRTLEHSRCPDCGYDLFHVPAALPAARVAGAGPSRCPECGSMWPLVPPPVDVDTDSRGEDACDCGYSRAGLPDGAPCPECGKSERVSA